MKIRRHSHKYNFIGDTQSGITFRWGRTPKENPASAPWPELADISISNHCSKGCDFCYRDSKINNTFMSVEDYIYILQSLQHPHWGNVFQIAIGGGEPLEHPMLKEIIEATLSYNIIPNLTTNGANLDNDIIKFFEGKIGAIAISLDDIELIDFGLIRLLQSSSLQLNIHYVLSNKNINQAIKILCGNFNQNLTGIKNIVFLTHKPHGRAKSKDNLILDSRFLTFLKNIDNNKCSARIGFDACFVPHLLHFTEIPVECIDSCECGFFSIYIDENLNVKTCSFDNNLDFSYSLREFSFEDIWSNKLEVYRNKIQNNCKRTCKGRDECRGACFFYNEITCCYTDIKEDALYV